MITLPCRYSVNTGCFALTHSAHVIKNRGLDPGGLDKMAMHAVDHRGRRDSLHYRIKGLRHEDAPNYGIESDGTP